MNIGLHGKQNEEISVIRSIIAIVFLFLGDSITEPVSN